jgi:hypothetical protein
MATINITGSIQVGDSYLTGKVARTFAITPTGSASFAAIESVGTAAATMAIADCATLRYAGLYNPTDSGATVTATMAAIVLRPGDVAILPPANTLVTLQSTGAATNIYTAGAEQ